MIEETARVVAREGDEVWVEAERRSACGGCSAASGCGTGALAGVFGRRTLRLRAHDETGAAVGDRVRIGLDEAALVRGSLAVYLVPLLTLLGGALLGESLAPQWGIGSAEGASIALGVAGLAAGMLWVRVFSRGAQRSDRFRAVVLGPAGTVQAVVLSPGVGAGRDRGTGPGRMQ